MQSRSSISLTRKIVEAQVRCWGVVRAAPDQLTRWRKAPSGSVPPSLLKHSEDQTVAGMWAVADAVAKLPETERDFSDWSIVSAPRYFGREGSAASLAQFCEEGPWGISPHMVPHHSVHAISGTISQAFAIRGMSFGAGNGAASERDGWLAAATLLADPRIPGLWLVLTGHEEEFLPAEGARPASSTSIEAIALALAPGRSQPGGCHVRLCPDELLLEDAASDPLLASLSDVTLSQLIDELNRDDGPPAGMWRLPGIGWVELETR